MRFLMAASQLSNSSQEALPVGVGASHASCMKAVGFRLRVTNCWWNLAWLPLTHLQMHSSAGRLCCICQQGKRCRARCLVFGRHGSSQRLRCCEWLQVEDLARLSFKRQPLYVGVDDRQDAATREGLEQGYCVVPSAQRFLLLFTFLKKNASKKVPLLHRAAHSVRCDMPHISMHVLVLQQYNVCVWSLVCFMPSRYNESMIIWRMSACECWMQVMVFFSSCNSVKYHAELLNYIDIPVKDIHGKQKQQRRTTTFMDFCKVRRRPAAAWQHLCRAAVGKPARCLHHATPLAVTFSTCAWCLVLPQMHWCQPCRVHRRPLCQDCVQYLCRLVCWSPCMEACTNLKLRSRCALRRQTKVCFCARTWQREAWTSRRWTGSFSTTRQTTPRNTSTGLAALPGAALARGAPSCCCSLKRWASCATSRRASRLRRCTYTVLSCVYTSSASQPDLLMVSRACSACLWCLRAFAFDTEGHVVQAAKVPLNEYEFPTSKVANVQSQLEKLVAKNYYLHSSARDAYRCTSCHS